MSTTPPTSLPGERSATGPSDLLAQLLPAWRLTMRTVPRDYFDRFLTRHRPRVEAAFGRLLAQIAMRRYLAARWPPDDAYFLRDQWKQELRFEGNTPKAQALAREYRRQTGHEPGEGVEHRAGAFRAEWLSGDHEVSIQGPVTAAEQRILLARYRFARRGSEHVQAWMPAAGQRAGPRAGRAAIAVWSRATHAVDRLASGDYRRPANRRG